MKSNRSAVALLALVGMAVLPAVPSARADGSGRGRTTDNGVYIVQMKAAPVVAYTGDVPGYRATKPAKGQKIDPNDPHVTTPGAEVADNGWELYPLGFALEHYDGTGSFRDDDAGFAIDATGALIDGTSFDGASELSLAIRSDERFPRCIVEKLMTYGLGRGLEPKDDCFVEESVASFAAEGYTLESLLVSLVKSEAFRTRRGEAP